MYVLFVLKSFIKDGMLQPYCGLFARAIGVVYVAVAFRTISLIVLPNPRTMQPFGTKFLLEWQLHDMSENMCEGYKQHHFVD